MKGERDQLIDFLDLYSVKSGEEFTLASGQKSNTYVNVKKTAMNAYSYKLLARLLFDKMIEKFNPVEAVAGVVLGGCHLASMVAMQHPLNINTIYVRKEAKDHGTKNLVEKPDGLWLARTVIVEDVITTGGSALAAAELLRQAQLDVVGILTVVDRRVKKDPYLGNQYPIVSLIDFEELHP